MPRAPRLIHITEIEHQYPVELRQHSPERFQVRYGRAVHDNLTYHDAARQYGLSVMHALGCSGALQPLLGRSYVRSGS